MHEATQFESEIKESIKELVRIGKDLQSRVQ